VVTDQIGLMFDRLVQLSDRLTDQKINDMKSHHAGLFE
jgi:hypothetical protein